jgi:hypothetical protein
MYDDTEIVTSGINPTLLAEMASDYADGIRNEASYTEQDLIQMEREITVRTAPERRDVTDPATDAVGQIDPADRADFADWCVDRFVPGAFRVDDAGRVFVRRGHVCEGEAEFVTAAICEYNAGRAVAREAAAGKGKAA